MGDWTDVIDDGWSDVKPKKKKFQIQNYQSPEYAKAQALKDIAKEQGTGQSMLIGAGRELDKFGAGIADLADMGLEFFGSEDATTRRGERQTEQKSKDEMYSALSDVHPIATGVGGVAPYLATAPIGAGGAAVRGAPLLSTTFAKTLATDVGIGALEGASHYDDTATSGAGFGAAGSVGGKYLDKLLGGVPSQLKGDEGKVVDFAEKNKLFVPPGMATGSVPFQQMDRSVATHRATADKYQEQMNKSNVKKNEMIAKELGGETTDYFTEDYLTKEAKRITGDMDTQTKGVKGIVNEDDAFGATGIIDKYKATSIDDIAPPILTKAENNLYKLADEGGELTGEQYQNIARNLRSQATQQYKNPNGDKLLAKSLSDMAGTYDDIIGKAMPDKTGDSFKKSRREFALLKGIEDSVDVTGDVSARELAKKFKSSENINMLGKVDELRKKSSKTSLGTSALLGKMLRGDDPSQQMGAGALLSAQTVGGVLPIMGDMATGAYLKGYPHKTGIIPGMPKGTVNRLGTRLGQSASDDPETERKQTLEELLRELGIGE